MSTILRLSILASLLFAGTPAGSCAAGAPRATVREIREVTWEEAADRCPAPPEVAPTATGHHVVLELAGGVYHLFVQPERSTLCQVETIPDIPPSDPELHELTLRSAAALAVRLSPAMPPIQIRRAERVVWRDSSAGCPEPGRFYSQMLTEGARFVLRAGGRSFLYHQAEGGTPFLCEKPSPIKPRPAADEQ